jgi:hypothetical protein
MHTFPRTPHAGSKALPEARIPVLGRRAFVKAALHGSFALAAGTSLSARLMAQAAAIATMPVRAEGIDESTRRMAALLRKIARDADPVQNPYRNAERVPLIRQSLAKITDPTQKLKIRMTLADELLRSGDPMGGLKEHEITERQMFEQGIQNDDPMVAQLSLSKALCYLRIGELENCCANHNAESCLFPIHGGGVHTLPRGSRGAVAELTKLLVRHPTDLRARWLLNIAYMTLGEYPSKVPRAQLLDPRLFESDYDIGTFHDVAASVGLAVDGLAGGVVLEDLDNDGFLDIMVSSWGLTHQLRYFHNNGNGTFTERTEQAGLMGEVGGLNLIHCDYNNDGFMDVLVLRGAWLGTEGHYPLSLLRNNGDGTFTDVTEEAGLLRFRPTQTAAWFDYNGDGWLDLFVGNESNQGDPNNPCELFRNNGDGTFTECAAQHGLDLVGFFKGVASADYNNDGRPDLFLSRKDGSPILMRNDGPATYDQSTTAPWRFTDVTEQAGITEPQSSFPCWFFDYNNDGWLDIMVTGYAIKNVGDVAADYMGLPHNGQVARLYRNNGDGTFTDVSAECGVHKILHTMGCNFGDLDNDGWLDFYVGTGDPDLGTLIPNRMFRNDGGKRFQEVTSSGGFGQLQKGHGIAFGDINNNGTQDIYSVVGGAVEGDHYTHQLFANPGQGNNWLKLKLEGVKTNRAAIGARIKVVVRTDGGEREIHRAVGSGASFGSSSMRQEIGLEQARAIIRTEIYWPATGITQVVNGLEMNRLYHVREGSAAICVPLKSFEWPSQA